MSTQSVSIDDVRVLKVALGWHEAVALVQEVAVVTGPRGSMPDPDLIILTPLGELSVQGDLDSPEPPQRALAELLQSLLGGPGVPPNLRQLVADTLAEGSAHDSVEKFVKALSFFERPNRRADIAAVCTRTAAAAAQVRSDIELERIRARRSEAARSKPSKVVKKPLALPAWLRAVPIKTVAITAATVAAIGVFSVAAMRVLNQPPSVEADSGDDSSTSQAMLGAAKTSLTQFAQASLAAVGIKTYLTPPEAAPAAEETPVVPEVRPRVARSTAASTIESTSERPVDVTVRLDPVEPVMAPPAAVEHAALPGAVERSVTIPLEKSEYGPGDADVTPASLSRPQIPTFEPVEGTIEEVGILDLLVDETGGVSQVRLVSPTNRFQERMLVSAAKAWRFNPATKDGHPVPYRLRVRITI